MKLRKGMYKVALKRLKRGDLRWFIQQALAYSRIKRAYNSTTGKTSVGPIIAHLFSTSRCNLSCFMCDIPGRVTKNEMTTSECKGLLGQLKKLGVKGVSFTGGEPLLRTDIFELLRHAKSLGLETILVTNGILLGKHSEEIARIEPTIVDVSLDGSRPEIQDKIRGLSGAFSLTLSGMQQLIDKIASRKLSTDVVVSTVLSNMNVDDLDGILKLCQSLKVSRVILCPVHRIEGDKASFTCDRISCDYDISSFLLNHKLRYIIDDSDYYLSKLDSVIKGDAPPQGCSSGYTTIFFDWEMKVYPCKAHLELGRPMANLRTDKRNLSEIWHSEEYNEFRRKSKKCQMCFMTVNREFDNLFL